MIIPYKSSQKAILIREVKLLCRKLGRPVCSKDLAAHWKEVPENRPALLQGVGQLLLKATRQSKTGTPCLSKVGIFRNLAFYAPDESSAWAKAFAMHEVQQRARLHARWGIPEQAIVLLGTEHEALARNALAGFLVEWESVAKEKSIVLPDRMHELLDIARKEKPGKFMGKCPPLLGRVEALAVLVAELKSRNPFFEGGANFNRHLAKLVWPMSSLFREKGFWEFQVRAYCAARWPSEEDDPLVSNAAFRVMGYG